MRLYDLVAALGGWVFPAQQQMKRKRSEVEEQEKYEREEGTAAGDVEKEKKRKKKDKTRFIVLRYQHSCSYIFLSVLCGIESIHRFWW